ncbi:MAG TPA: CAP domain-containing protein [Streptosporangiaceae bacterium]
MAVIAVGYLATTTAGRILRATGMATVSSSGNCPSSAPSSASACPRAALAPAPDHPSVSPASQATATAGTGSPSATPDRPAGTATTTPARHTPAATLPAVRQVLKLINKARAEAGLPGYTLTAGLRRSSGRHNHRMAHGCGLSHQCPGEPPLGKRETDAGVNWTTAGENIGEGGPMASTPAAITHMALTLTQDMLGEKPPNDGHRLNLLNRAFHHIGIAIYMDNKGTVWMTQDFSN